MKIQNLTLGGILTALTIIFLYLASIFETNTLALLTLASFMVPIGLMRADLKTAALIYISSSLLSFFTVPLNIAFLYSLFFGIYGLIKYFTERFQLLPLEIFLKLIFFNSIFFILFMLMQKLLGYTVFSFLNTRVERYLAVNFEHSSFIILILVAQFGFLIFDYALTLLIHYYRKYASRF